MDKEIMDILQSLEEKILDYERKIEDQQDTIEMLENEIDFLRDGYKRF